MTAATARQVTTPSREEAKRNATLILIVEDNEINRTVILQQLRLIGYTADVAIDGQDALERWRSGSYALVLTDLYMPVLDGYALTAAIRSEESPHCHTPIIALTANALRNEELRCRAAGMDNYLSKPARLGELKTAIDTELARVAAEGIAPAAAAVSTRVSPPVDLSVLTALVGDDPAVFEEVIRIFHKSAAQSRRELRQGLEQASMCSIGDAAHKLKSAARSIGADCLGAYCAEIEQATQEGLTGALEVLMEKFETEADTVFDFLALK